MKSSHITILAYVTMTLLFGAALSQVVAPANDDPFSNTTTNNADGDGVDDTNNIDNTNNNVNNNAGNAGGLDPDTNANPFRQIFAQGFVGGRLPVNSIAKVPFIFG